MAKMNLLSDAKVRAAKPEARAARQGRGKALEAPTPEQLQIAPRLTKLSDGGGLMLWVEPTGARRWRFAYRFGGKQKSLAFGSYPEVSLAEAREDRDSARKMLARGIDPSENKRATRAALAIARTNTFEAIGKELLEKQRRENKAPATLSKTEYLLRLAAPLASRPITEITAPEILTVLQKVEARGKYATAIRLRGFVSEVFCFAIATARCQGDPTSALRKALTTHKIKHRAAILEPKEFGALLRAVDGVETGAPETKLAMQLLALTFVRPGELRHAEWSEFNLDDKTWIIPAHKTKARREHRVPLSMQSLAIIHELRTISRGGKFVFPNGRSKARCMSENALPAVLRRLGYGVDDASPHGFRASASSQLNASGLWHRDAIERQLGHADDDAVRAAYARSDYWSERVQLMQWWADRCDEMRDGATVAKAA